ncbi:hypothetical protein [Kineococcus terrestris]|uniref:hypothetical protein n=1 Tax=Kineococcus terrestris TaxID=2044856 RepID=UPI0034DADEBD
MLLALAAEVANQSEEHSGSLPIPPTAFGIVAICILMSMLLVTWAFRSVGQRH